MGLLQRFKGLRSTTASNTVQATEAHSNAPEIGDEKAAETKSIEESQEYETDSDNLSLEERNEKEVQLHPQQITDDAQLGQKKAEAVALVWPTWALYSTYAWIWFSFFMLALQQGTTLQLNAAAFVDFVEAPNTIVASILSVIIGGTLKLPIAKILNIWGRAEGFACFILVYVLGMIVLATSKGTASYSAGYVLYWIGFDAIYLILDVFVADTTGLKNRAFAFAFVGTPFICTAFTAPLLGAAFLNHSSWRWGYGAFCIINTAIFMPLVIVFKFYEKKAHSMGLFVRGKSGRNAAQSLLHYFHEFDIIGCLLLIGACVLFLLPFSLQSNGKADYHSATFIAMVVVGLLLFPAFYVWEKYFTKVQFMRWELLQNRTVLGACGLSMIVWFSFYSWDLYFYNFLLVMYELNFSNAGYMTQIYNVGSTFWGVIFGIYIRITKHFKWACFFWGVPIMMLGAGLMIHFRSAEYAIGYLVMCQIFIAFGGGTLVIGEDMAVMAAADREGVPLMLSLVQMASNFGGAIGIAVSGAIYNNVFQQTLTDNLPEAVKFNATAINLGGYAAQLAYPKGDPIRIAIDDAWGASQRYGSISATCILLLGFPAIALWKNYNVDRKQNKGNVI